MDAIFELLKIMAVLAIATGIILYWMTAFRRGQKEDGGECSQT